jgi:outer membrane immunogenic protein
MKIVACTLLLSAAGFAAGVHPALAADPVREEAPVVYNWNGFYIGANIGGLWGDKDWVEVVGPVPGGEINPDYSGVIGGVQAGLNYQIQQWVLGVEGEWTWTDADGASICIVGFDSCGVELNWVATLGARVGYAFDNVLPYVEGGAAWVDEKYHVAPGTPFAIDLDDTRTGYFLGAGIEYGFAPNWSAKLEYNYLDFGTDRLNFGGAIEDITQRSQTVRVGFNYRFDAW